MNRNQMGWKACASLLMVLLTASVGMAQVERPNFIVIFTDDQGYQDLGCYGSPSIKTPRLDQMAKEGMRFTSFYAQTVCGPSRAALMTGSYPLRTERHSGDDGTFPHPALSLNEITVAEVLKPLGYRTGMAGKWDLSGREKTFQVDLHPGNQGFDESFWTMDHKAEAVRDGNKVVLNKAPLPSVTKLYTDRAIEFCEANKDRPFFFYLAHPMPHTPIGASEKFKGNSAAGLYGDVIEELDFNVGRVLDKLKELGLDDRTYVIFTSDNGPWLIRKEHGGHAHPLRSGKTSCWEGGLRVPCIIRAPGRVPAGTECKAVTATIDLMPTIANLAGGKVPIDRVIDGIDLSPLLHGKAESLDRPYFYYQHNCLRAVRSGRWKLMLPHTEPPAESIAAVWNSHVAPNDAQRIEKAQLYDLDADIGETTDLAAQHPEIIAELTRLAAWAKQDIGDHDKVGANARRSSSTNVPDVGKAGSKQPTERSE